MPAASDLERRRPDRSGTGAGFRWLPVFPTGARDLGRDARPRFAAGGACRPLPAFREGFVWVDVRVVPHPLLARPGRLLVEASGFNGGACVIAQ